MARELKVWGEPVAVDHVVCKNWLGHNVVSGHSDLFSFFDRNRDRQSPGPVPAVESSTVPPRAAVRS